MNISKTIAFGLLFFSTIGMTTAQIAEKTLVKSFNLQGHDQVVLNLDGPVDVQSWDSKTVRVQMSISLKNRSESFLKAMLLAGRYNLESTNEEDALVIYQPGMERAVQLKSGELEETMNFMVFAPENVHVEVNSEASSSSLELKAGGLK